MHHQHGDRPRSPPAALLTRVQQAAPVVDLCQRHQVERDLAALGQNVNRGGGRRWLGLLSGLLSGPPGCWAAGPRHPRLARLGRARCCGLVACWSAAAWQLGLERVDQVVGCQGWPIEHDRLAAWANNGVIARGLAWADARVACCGVATADNTLAAAACRGKMGTPSRHAMRHAACPSTRAHPPGRHQGGG